MTWLTLLFAFGKILVVILFLLNAAAIATWADRRQSAMVQDRVGPNRAVAYLPNLVARAIVFLPGLLLGILAMFAFFRPPRSAGLALDRMTLALELSILVGWFGLMLLCAAIRKGKPVNSAEERLDEISPRSVFYVGLALHVVAFVVTRLVPVDALAIGSRIAGGLLWVVLVSASFYAASRLPDGPIPVRLAGMLHAGADAIKLIWKEDFVPKNADKLLHALAPIIAMFPALVTFAVIPFGSPMCFGDDGSKVFDWADLGRMAATTPREFSCPGGHVVGLQVADLNVGILYLFAMAGTGVIGAAIAGWASDNKFSLLGGLRAASQMVSYEVAMGLSLVGLFLITSSVRLGPIVDWQGENAWGIFVQPLAFILFIAALGAEGKRVPFDQPEGESEIVAGYFVEYSGMKFGMFFTGEYVELITSSALLVTLFLGGYHLPFLHADGLSIAFGDNVVYQFKMSHAAVTVIHFLTFFGKTILMVWLQIFFRWTLPRFRYDQLMRLGWTKLLPLAIGNLFVTGLLVLGVDAAPVDAKNALRVVADITQAIVALGMLAAVVALVAGLLEPTDRKKFLRSTAARFAAAAGGVKATPQQA